MNNVKYISREGYKALWDSIKGNAQITTHNIDPIMKNMKVMGKSGKGTSFSNEYERLKHEWLNPQMPQQINMVGIDGIIAYRVK